MGTSATHNFHHVLLSLLLFQVGEFICSSDASKEYCSTLGEGGVGVVKGGGEETNGERLALGGEGRMMRKCNDAILSLARSELVGEGRNKNKRREVLRPLPAQSVIPRDM
jgi:hypothetical protein